MNNKEKLAAFAAATNNELFDPDWNGGEWMVEAVETHETIDQFEQSSNGWTECSIEQRGEIAGLPYISWEKIQTKKGAQRRSLWVVDFGDARYAINADATCFA